MLPILTSQQSRQLDRLAEAAGIAPLVLMENAALRAAEVCFQHFELDSPSRIAVVAGKGNNGGDGLTLARHLTIARHSVKVFLLGNPDELRNEAAINYRACLSLGIPICPIRTDGDRTLIEAGLREADLVVDAVLGTGVTGSVQGLPKLAIDALNSCGKPILSIDIPSGLNADTGQECGVAVRAHTTITLGALKWGTVLYPGSELSGSLFLGGLGIPETVVGALEVRSFLMTAESMVGLLPVRRPNTHKGDYGKVLIIGGSPGMTGAAFLAGRAALRCGSGLAMVAVPSSLNTAAEAASLEVMSLPVDETETGSIADSALSQLSPRIEWSDVVAIGCGLSRHPRSLSLVLQIAEKVDKPLIIDADGLFAVAQDPGIVKKRKALTVLTPHPGEMAVLLKSDPQKVQTDRVGSVLAASEQYGAIVVLKGARTLVADPDGRVMANPTGNPGMATAGSGDVLTGMIASVLGQVMLNSGATLSLPIATQAVAAAVFLHGLAGDIATWEKGEWSLIASDIIDHLPRAIMEPELAHPIPLRPLSPFVRMIWRGRGEKGRIGWPVPNSPSR
ncbi:MAG: NAD(P)H-hydrate dehydratase [Armatimonadetes bacterium]|nr:NAD(P)H-hydrate dehydratase [Armatimonadota bacterium]MDW8122361.1 NAD(P)H-hydrate dehydratase [Armatimonadota bacterium]